MKKEFLNTFKTFFTATKIFFITIFVFFIATLVIIVKNQFNQKKNYPTKPISKITAVSFLPPRQKRVRVQLFVMSFCPYANQVETSLALVYPLLKDYLDFEPHYIIEKQNQAIVEALCQEKIYDEERCRRYINQGYFPNLEACRQRFYPNLQVCLAKESVDCLVTPAKSYYCSQHGRGELNQDIRETCAWELAQDKEKWWEFIGQINRHCSADNIDSCWQNQAQALGLDQEAIQNCFNRKAIKIAEENFRLSQRLNITASPTLIINDQIYPPTTKEKVKIGDQVFEVSELYSPEAIKTAICLGLESKPTACQTKLTRQTETNTGSCR